MSAKQDIPELILSRIDRVNNGFSGLSQHNFILFPQIEVLTKLILEKKTDLTYNKDKSPLDAPGSPGEFFIDPQKCEFYFSDEFLNRWQKMIEHYSLSEKQLCNQVDNFIIHEFFHLKQGVNSWRYADTDTAACSMSAVDYYADALATLCCFLLLREENSEGRWSDDLASSCLGCLHQILIFDWNMANKPKNFDRFLRHVYWHFQFHRSERNSFTSIDQMQILFEPRFDFPGLGPINLQGLVNRDWPLLEAAHNNPTNEKMPTTFGCHVGSNGVPHLSRLSLTKSAEYERFFEGIFTGDVEKTEGFFAEMFEQDPSYVSEERFDNLTSGTKVLRGLVESKRDKASGSLVPLSNEI